MGKTISGLVLRGLLDKEDWERIEREYAGRYMYFPVSCWQKQRYKRLEKQIKEYRARGLTLAKIGKLVGLSVSGVGYHLGEGSYKRKNKTRNKRCSG